MTTAPAVRPNRVRRVNGQSFAFIPHRFLREGFLASLTETERSLYLFLVLAADHQGVSFYGYDRICSTLELPLESYLAARNGLIDKDLVAFDGRRFQVLSLPAEPLWSSRPALQTAADLEEHDPGTIPRLLLDGLGDDASAR